MDTDLQNPEAEIVVSDTEKLQPCNNRIQTTTPDLQQLILQELRDLRDLGHIAANDPTLKYQARSNLFLQVFGLVTAALFGVFAILAWISANKSNRLASSANEMASIASEFASSAESLASQGNLLAADSWRKASVANVLAFIGYCDTKTSIEICTRLQPVVPVYITNIAEYIFHDETPFTTPSATPLPTVPSLPHPSGSGAKVSQGLIAGATIGAIAGLMMLCGTAYLSFLTYKAKVRRSAELLRKSNY